MAFPAGWPPRLSSGIRSISFFAEGTATVDYEDSALLFIDGIGANTFQPTPYVPPGGEDVVTPITSGGPGSPLGTGRDARDAIPYNPNVFFRGFGLGTSRTTFVFAAGVVTYTDFTKKFNLGMVGKEMRITGSTSVANDGTFIITEVVSDHVIRWENAAGVTEDFPVTGEFRMRVLDEAPPKAAIWSDYVLVTNGSGVAIYISFDGINDHGIIPANSSKQYSHRIVAGIALRAASGTADYVVEAW
jgi:hypothetical protein